MFHHSKEEKLIAAMNVSDAGILTGKQKYSVEQRAKILNGIPDLHKSISDKIIEEIINKINLKLILCIKQNLSNSGYNFIDHEDFLKFFKNRVVRINNNNVYRFYINYKDENNTGSLIGIFSSEVEMNITDGIVNLTINNPE